MSKDLLKRKKKRFLNAGGLKPPADLLMSGEILPDTGESEVSQEASAGSITEPAEGAALISTQTEDSGSPVSGGDETGDGLDLVFSDLFDDERRETGREYVPPFYRKGKRAVIALMCVLFSAAVIYNTVYYSVLRTEVESFIKNTPDNISPIPAELADSREPEGDAQREYTLYLTCDGQTADCRLTGEPVTVERLLEEAGVTLSDEDIVEPELSAVLSDRDSVTVTRIRHTEYTESAVIPASTDIKQTPLLADGRQRELYAYRMEDGEKLLRYRDEYINGVRTEHELIEETVVTEPVNSITLEGASVSMSAINGARFTDIMINGNAPEDYITCITGPCTAYNFDEGVWGASGMYLSQGFVAADPSVIPYGSLLYITSSDGSFVYGWAIVADYCEASAEGRVTVDLFFDTYEETLLFGKHVMNVYIVKQLYRDELQEYVARQGYFDNRVPGRP